MRKTKNTPQSQMTKICSLNDWKRLVSNGNEDKKGQLVWEERVILGVGSL